MNLNIKAKNVLGILLKKLEESLFDENDIINLLRYLRPYEIQGSLIWEFACFVAHTEQRTRGFIHQELDLNYAKLIYFPKFGTTVSKKLNVLKIEKKLFKLLFEIGLKNFPDKDFKERTGVNKSVARKILKQSYDEEKGYYLLNKISAIKDIYIIANCIYSLIDFRLAIRNELLLNQLRKALEKICMNLNTNYIPYDLIKNNEKDLLICFMSIINHHQFKLYDNKIGTTEIDISQIHKEKKLLLRARIVLGTTNFNWPIMSLDNMDNFVKISEKEFDSPSLIAQRMSNGNLILNL